MYDCRVVERMKICICCSRQYFPKIKEFLTNKKSSKHEFLIPTLDFEGEINEKTKKKLSGIHHKKIAHSDAIYLYNPMGEVGKNTILETGYALALNKKIFALNKTGEPGIDCFIQKFLSLNELEQI